LLLDQERRLFVRCRHEKQEKLKAMVTDLSGKGKETIGRSALAKSATKEE